MRNQVITEFENKQFPRTVKHPDFRPGDTVRVHYKIEEKPDASVKFADKKFRLQAFEGVCIRFKKGNANSSFTVRKIGANGIGVERIFPYCSPYIEKVDLVSSGVVRRSRLYYLRNLFGKAARITTRRLPAGTQMTTKKL